MDVCRSVWQTRGAWLTLMSLRSGLRNGTFTIYSSDRAF
jgi:hypothetical protein